jgi:hypothetical protein
MKSDVLGAIALSVTMMLSARAQTLVGPLNAVTGINELTVNGQTLNVTFLVNVPYATAFSGNNPFFSGNSSGGKAAANAIGIFLSSAGASAIAGGNSGSEAIFVPVGMQSAGLVPSWEMADSGTFPTIWGVALGIPGGANFVDFNAAGAPNDAWAIVSAAQPSDSTSDGPIPLWAIGALGAGLIGVASRRLKKVG